MEAFLRAVVWALTRNKALGLLVSVAFTAIGLPWLEPSSRGSRLRIPRHDDARCDGTLAAAPLPLDRTEASMTGPLRTAHRRVLLLALVLPVLLAAALAAR